jgi:hypothetical protein
MYPKSAGWPEARRTPIQIPPPQSKRAACLAKQENHDSKAVKLKRKKRKNERGQASFAKYLSYTSSDWGECKCEEDNRIRIESAAIN